MAGIVQAHIEEHADHSIDVRPIACPGADMHTQGVPRCYTVMFDGERRACVYWQATTMPGNDTHRQDPSMLARESFMRNVTQMRCAVLCQRARANRPIGC